MRRLRNLVNIVIWSLLTVYLAALLLVNVPAVQTFLGSKAAAAIAGKLGTTVSVGRIDLGMLNRLIIDDIMVYDQAGQPLLAGGRLSVKMELLPLLEGRVAIASAQLFGIHASLYKTDSLAKPNYQFIVDSLSSDNTDGNSPLDLRINSLIVRHSSVSYDELDAPATPGRLNLRHLHTSNISAHIILKALSDDSLNVNLKRLSFDEQSGLSVQSLAMKMEVGDRQALLTGLELRLSHSRLHLDSLSATYQRDRLAETLRYEGTVDGSHIDVSDMAFLMPEMRSLGEQLAVGAAFSGTAHSIAVQQLGVTASSGRLNLQMTGTATNDVSPAAWSAHVQQLYASGDLLEKVKATIGVLPEELLRVGSIQLAGEGSGRTDGTIEAQGDIHTDIGSLALLFDTSNGHLKGWLATDSLDLGRLTDNDDLGNIAAHINIAGTTDDIKAEGTVARLEYKGYPYQGITVDGSYRHGDIGGKLKVDDPNLKTDIEGELRRQSRTSIRLTGIVEQVTPSTLHLTDRWGDATFSAIVDADFTASSLNDAEGSIDLDDFTMITTDSTYNVYRIENLHIKSGYDDDTHFLSINGDMGEARLKGDFDWATLPQSFVNYMASKLPTLPGLPKATKATDNNFEVLLQLRDTRWMERLLGVPMQLEQPMRIEAMVNDAEHQIEVRGHLPQFTYGGQQYQKGDISLSTTGDTARCHVGLVRMGETQMPLTLSLDATAADNLLNTSLQWRNDHAQKGDEKSVSGTLNAITELLTNEQGNAEAHVRVQPSAIMLEGVTWLLEPCDILYTKERLLVDHFYVGHGQQHLIVDGIASTLPTDTLMVDLNQVDVSYVLDLVNFTAVHFNGLATGKAWATALFNDFAAWADIRVDDFHFQHGALGTLAAKARWNGMAQQIDIDAVATEDNSAQTFVDGFISPVRNEMRLDIRAEDSSLDFVNSFTSGFLSGVKGTAKGNLCVAGDLKHLNLTGAAVADGQATVRALNTTYNLHGDTVHFVPNDIVFDGVNIYDRNGKTATLHGGVHHDELSDFTFDIDVTASELLAYDFPDFADGVVCGTVYATGTCDMHGRPGEVVINCDVTPTQGSSFAYNAANPDAISKQEFITWTETTGGEQPNRNTAEFALPVTQYSGGSDIYINFLINTTPTATMKVLMDAKTNDYITLNGDGVIRASFHNRGPFHMFGTYTVDHGTYGITIQNIIKKNFTFQQGGTIVFGGDPFDANLNLQAVYTVNGVSLSDLNIGNSFTNNTVRVNCLMNIGGTPGQPQVEFDLDMPTVNSEENQMIRSVITSEQELNQQVLYLLGIGRFYTQGSNNADMQQYDQTTLAMQSFLSGTVSTQINEVLSQVIKSNDWNFGANISTGNEGWHNAEYEGLVSGRMLNNRLLLNGQFGYRDNATTATPSFIGDFDLRYLLTPNGNMAVKVYNQTNDRYFTRSSLNTQGVGLILKKDFNGLGELFLRRKSSRR